MCTGCGSVSSSESTEIVVFAGRTYAATVIGVRIVVTVMALSPLFLALSAVHHVAVTTVVGQVMVTTTIMLVHIRYLPSS